MSDDLNIFLGSWILRIMSEFSNVFLCIYKSLYSECGTKKYFKGFYRLETGDWLVDVFGGNERTS